MTRSRLISDSVIACLICGFTFALPVTCQAAPAAAGAVSKNSAKKPLVRPVRKAVVKPVFVPLKTPKPMIPMMIEMPASPGTMPFPPANANLPRVGGGTIGPDNAPFHQWSYEFEASSPMAFQVPMTELEACLDKLYAAAHPGKTLGGRNEGAMAKIGFYLMRDGRVTSARILESSTNPQFKAEALNLVRKLRLPKGWQKGPSLVVCELTIYGGESNPHMDPEPDDGSIP